MILLLACTATVPGTPNEVLQPLASMRIQLDSGEDPPTWESDWLPGDLELYEGDQLLHAGRAGLHVRGNSSRDYDKKSFALETWDADDQDLDVALGGLPAEEDWVLQGPYSDKSLMRNHLAYTWYRAIDRYAARTRFVELSLNGSERGVYVLMEKIKRDENRVDLPAGAALLKRDWIEDEEIVLETASCGDELLLKWPDEPGDIEDRLSAVEAELLAGDTTHVDLDSFVDHMLMVELGRNVDAYVLSTWIELGEDDTLRMGPVWDFNGALGNADYFEAWESEGWHYDNPEFPADNPRGFCWYEALLEDEAFLERRRERWRQHRAGPWSDEALLGDIEAARVVLEPAVEANFERWPVLGTYVWPNDEGAEDRASWEEELDYLSSWTLARAAWLDGQL